MSAVLPYGTAQEKRHSILTMYEILYTPDVLHRAFNRAMRGHRNDAEHAAAEAHKIETIEYLARQLRRETYEPRPLRQFWVTEPKRRQIQAPCVMDKIVQNALVDGLLYDWLTKPFIRDCYSSVKGRGTSDGLARLKLFMGEYYRCHGAEGWVLKCDIHHYFDSIDQSDVLRRAERYVPDARVMALLAKYVRLTSHGLPLGLRTSQPLANLELCEIDHRIKEVYRCRYYGRYMDDFYIIHSDKAFLKELRREIEAGLAAIGLRLNDKTQIFPLAHGIEFLGFRTYMTDTGKVVRVLRQTAKTALKRGIKQYEAMYRAGAAHEEIQQSYRSRRAHLMQGNCRGLMLRCDAKMEDIFKEENMNE